MYIANPEMSDSKVQLELAHIWHLSKGTIHFQRSDKTTGKDLYLGVANGGKANIWETRQIKASQYSLLCRSLWCCLQVHTGLNLSLVINLFFLVERKGGTPVNLCPAFMQIEGGQSFLRSASFQLPSTQNNPYAKVACCGVAYSATLHLHVAQSNGHTQSLSFSAYQQPQHI